MSRRGEPPDGGFGWVIVFCAFMLHVLSLGVAYTLTVHYPTLQEDFQTDPATTAWVAGAHLGVMYGSGSIAGFLLQKYSTRTISFAGSLIFFIGAFGSSFADSIYGVIVTLGVISGLGNGFMFISAVTAVTKWFSRKRSLATGLAVCGAGFGVFAFSPLMRWLIAEYGRQGSLLIEAGLASHGCIFSLLLRPVPGSDSSTTSVAPLRVYVGRFKNASVTNLSSNGQITKESHPLQERSGTPADPQEGNVGSLLKNWIFWIFAGSQFLGFLSASVPLVFLYNRAVKDFEIERLEASYIISIAGVANTLGRLIIGSIGNVFPGGRLYLLSGSIVLYGVAAAASVVGGSYWVLALYAAVYGAGYGAMFAITTVCLADFFGLKLFGISYGFMGLFRGLACLVGPPIGGWIVSNDNGVHSTLFIVSGIVGIVGGATLLLVPLLQKLTSKLERKKSLSTQNVRDLYA